MNGVEKVDIGFTAVERFDRTWAESWNNYIGWSKLYHLEEVISLDTMLCPLALKKLSEDDYKFSQIDDGHYNIFSDLNWLLERIKGIENVQLLAVIFEPSFDCSDAFNDKRFEFCGYDLVEDGTRISALLNCGGFDEAFSGGDLSSCGLISNYNRARQVKEKLREAYPNEAHADCEMWAIWRMIKS